LKGTHNQASPRTSTMSSQPIGRSAEERMHTASSNPKPPGALLHAPRSLRSPARNSILQMSCAT
jgi:hypothetical protein